MPSLYVSEPRATVRRCGASIVVTTEPREPGQPDKLELARAEPAQLESIVLAGEVHLTLDALRLCLAHSVQVAWLSRSGRFEARLVPPSAGAFELRLAHFKAWSDAGRRLDLARCFVDAKLHNARAVLAALRANRPAEPALARALAALESAREAIGAVSGLESLLGLEGAGAAAYFSGLGACFSGPITFAGRSSNPPPDPANALLSFGYVLLGNLVASMLEARGLDPAMGLYHEPRAGRDSLALDLLEEFRQPVVDRFVLRAANLRIFSPDDFEPDDRAGVRMTSPALKRFFRQWEEHLAKPLQGPEGQRLAVRPWIHRQVESLARALRTGEAYQPFLWRDS